jgi:predicted unusual protein kinase regulating ubiquinone biosynthesis (AarF/ABC1/UbiB family)
VVKIQYPGVAQAIREDLANTELLTTLLRFAASAAGVTSDLRSVARESAARIAEETDYRHEAATIAAFSDLYRGHPFIRVPDAVPEVSTERVLTMTYVHGIDWAAAQHADQSLKDTWTEVIMRFFHGNFRHANFLHADPHPGNYRFGADGSVGFVDFGCVKVLPEALRLPWVVMNRAVIDGRFDVGRDLMVQLGFIVDDDAVTADDLGSWWDVMFTEIRMPQPVTYAPDATTRLLGELFSADAAKPVNRIRVPEDFAMFPRVQLALSHVAGALHATLPARAIHEDVDGVAEPVTELGRLHHAWVRERGLPSGLEAHPDVADQPRVG